MSTHEPESDPAVQPRWNIWPVAMFLCVIVLLWDVLLYESNDGREHRRAESLNHLKNIDLATHNYAAQNDGKLPPPALVGPEGMENFGWAVSLLPYLEAQAMYDRLDFDKPWNDPVNRDVVTHKNRLFLNPRVERPIEEEGYGLLHYAANSQVFRPGKTWGLDEISARDGLTNTIFFGEIGNRFRPWAAPGSLRDPAEGFGDGPRQFGITGSDLILFAFGDGSARAINRDIDPQILKALATPDGGEALPNVW